MARKHNVIFKVTAEEKNMIAQLAKRMERSQSDALRVLVRQAAQQQPTQTNNTQPSNGAQANGQKPGC